MRSNIVWTGLTWTTMRAWWHMVREKGPRRGLAETLRWIADRIGHEDAFCGGGMSVYLVRSLGWVVDPQGRRGVPVWYRRDEYYSKAHYEREVTND